MPMIPAPRRVLVYLAVYPFAASAVAINLFLLFLMLQAVGVTALSPLMALLIAGPLGLPATWLAVRWIDGLIREAEGRA
ncbi:hypothetical protein [Sagittula sp. S175]|uniref:hypothetical protein n=1 Tax=Sagittula sp. S175 TaxID=3415129 RepID=UPI003C7B4C93